MKSRKSYETIHSLKREALVGTVPMVEEAKEQLVRYLDRVGEAEGWVVIFDRKSEKTPEAKIYWKVEEIDGRRLNFVGC